MRTDLKEPPKNQQEVAMDFNEDRKAALYASVISGALFLTGSENRLYSLHQNAPRINGDKMIAQKRYTPFQPKKKMDLSCQVFDLEKIRKLKGESLQSPSLLYLCVYYNGRKGYRKEIKFKAESDEIALRRCQKILNSVSALPWAAKAFVYSWREKPR